MQKQAEHSLISYNIKFLNKMAAREFHISVCPYKLACHTIQLKKQGSIFMMFQPAPHAKFGKENGLVISITTA